jgi:hypothetical protein
MARESRDAVEARGVMPARRRKIKYIKLKIIARNRYT